MALKKIFPIGFLLCWCVSLYAQTEQFFSNGYYIEKFTAEDGLPGTSVASILQDTTGYLWLATHDGLAKYDGYQFEVFRTDTSANKSAYANFFYTLHLDQKHRLWAGTLRDGLYLFDLKEQTFVQHFLPNEADSNSIGGTWVIDLVGDARGQLWVKSDGIQQIDEQEDRFLFTPQSDLNQLNNPQFMPSTSAPFAGCYAEKAITAIAYQSGAPVFNTLDHPFTTIELVAPSREEGWFWVIGVSDERALNNWLSGTQKQASFCLSKCRSLRTLAFSTFLKLLMAIYGWAPGAGVFF
jgi:hypothetical protein